MAEISAALLHTEDTGESVGVRLRNNLLLDRGYSEGFYEQKNLCTLGRLTWDKDLLQVMLRTQGKWGKYLCVKTWPHQILPVLAPKSEDAVFWKTSWPHHDGKETKWLAAYKNSKTSMCLAVNPETLQVELMKPTADELVEIDPRVFLETEMGARISLNPSVCPAKFLGYAGDQLMVRDERCWWEEPSVDIHVDPFTNVSRVPVVVLHEASTLPDNTPDIVGEGSNVCN